MSGMTVWPLASTTGILATIAASYQGEDRQFTGLMMPSIRQCRLLRSDGFQDKTDIAGYLNNLHGNQAASL
ncbi:hypothetical protein [Notoacmeibacter marinus]|uniref:hypothetical protein n=1 Tax=Notoacmeibacter marinus TaxID=1876515 RepID=UPI00111DDF83|nr:hypothetical protein [Notoacmeibacter marinus]